MKIDADVMIPHKESNQRSDGQRPVSTNNLRIAPVFYATQVDLCGPFKVYTPHNKITTVKIWLAVYCCISTSTTLI